MISFKEDFSIINKQLDELGLEKHRNALNKKILRRLGAKGRTIARRSFRSTFGKGQTGELYRDLGYKLTRRNNVIIGARTGKNMMKANVLEGGATITPKVKDFLTYQINGKWYKSKMVVIKPRNWFQSQVSSYFESNQAEKYIEDILYKEVEKVFNKYRSKV